jgi:hypothetical protein
MKKEEGLPWLVAVWLCLATGNTSLRRNPPHQYVELFLERANNYAATKSQIPPITSILLQLPDGRRLHHQALCHHHILSSNMASLNLSTNGPSITKSYQSVVNSPPPSGAAAQSGTYGQWAVFTVSAPLVTAFQQDSGGKESVLKVQSTGGLFHARGEYVSRRLTRCRGRTRGPHRGFLRRPHSVCLS